MFARCPTCHAPFPANERLEHLPLGSRVAFDPARGRLWVVCRGCRGWSLAPIEERWEALEELERRVRNAGRVLARTDHVELLEMDGLEVVRVGGGGREEEAWWRYGGELTARRERYRKVSLIGSLGLGGAVLGGMAAGGATLIGGWWLWSGSREAATASARWLRFGSTAWRGEVGCPACGHPIRTLRFRDHGRLYLAAGSASGCPLDLVVPCPSCRDREKGGVRFAGPDGERVLRRVLAYRHDAGASQRDVHAATRMIEEAGSPTELARRLVGGGRRLAEIGRTGALGLEIAVNEHVEERLLAMELAELQMTWEREEELARIIDGELTEVPLLERLRRHVLQAG